MWFTHGPQAAAAAAYATDLFHSRVFYNLLVGTARQQKTISCGTS
jgi:hypothetical protein